MNSVKLNSLNKLRALMNLRLVQSPISGGRAISTTPPPLLNQPSSCVSSRQLPAPISTFVRHIRHAGDPRTRYEVAPPVNWGICIVPEKEVYVVERFGKYRKMLTPGFHLLIPVVDRIASVHSLEEEDIPIPYHSVVTMDNVGVVVNGVLYVKIVDPVLASYRVMNPLYEITHFAKAAVLFELHQITLDEIFGGRDTLNRNIVEAINKNAEYWGLKCLRYEIGFDKLSRMKIYLGQLLNLSLLLPAGNVAETSQLNPHLPSDMEFEATGKDISNVGLFSTVLPSDMEFEATGKDISNVGLFSTVLPSDMEFEATGKDISNVGLFSTVLED